MTNTTLRTSIKAALDHFTTAGIDAAARQLFATLGYSSDRTVATGSVQEFLQTFDTEVHFQNENVRESARLSEWKSVQLLFQITDTELGGQGQLFDANAFEPGNVHSYIFLTVELTGTSYPRGTFANITRRINRLFPTPVMVLFKYDSCVTIAVINRRPSKVDEHKDVLGKVTLIQDINYAQPHPGHLDILASFSVPELRQQKRPITNFDQLHAAWEEVFNVELLNKRFYRELSSWYFWARQQVEFPADLEPDAERRNSTSVIRLLTRLIFCWFLKEKGLIPDTLFDKEELAGHLKSLDKDDSTYYRAILQNLFFATLNQQMNVGGEVHRRFVTQERFNGRSKDHGVKNLYRYEDAFRDPAAALALFEDIPFLNGGLFACLDRAAEDHKELYADGFSENPRRRPVVPNNLFFAEPKQVDLSDAYGDKKFKKETVQGLIHILRRYKFTIAENTPVEQEIALDPELLGKVFENLLASYNPETGTTARKQTGSFYTPRPIVDYMVDESLKAYLAQELVRRVPDTKEADARDGLDILFAYTEKEHAFTPAETTALIAAIDACNILDPACGSGAFPMGILHKLVFILQKLDPENKQWHQRQVDKAEEIADPQARESAIQAINRDFQENAHDYGRKLYLIENCIYGVDIQPIAIQISKLRFFISLVCDQCTNKNRAANFGIKALPNLETKFVAANTLVGLEPAESDLFSSELDDVLKELAQVRHRYFSATNRATKLRLQDQDKSIRDRLKALLGKTWSRATSEKIAAWDPYDMFSVAQFFDPRWMFGQELAEGFDIIIGNPPYVQLQKLPAIPKQLLQKQNFKTYTATGDIYCLFYERGAELLRPGGELCYITSNKWMRADYGDKLRGFLSRDLNTTHVLDFGMAQNFGAATTYTCVVQAKKSRSDGQTLGCYAKDSAAAMADPAEYFEHNALSLTDLSSAPWVVLTPERYRVKQLVQQQGTPIGKWDVVINYGIKTGYNEAFYITQQERDSLIKAEPQAADFLVPLLRGRQVCRYGTQWDGTWMISTFPALNISFTELSVAIQGHLKAFEKKLAPKPKGYEGKWDGRKAGAYEWFETQDSIAYYRDFDKPKIIYPNMTKYLPFYYDREGLFYINDKAFILSSTGDSLPALTAVLNSSLFRCCFRDNFPELLGNAYEVRKTFIDEIPVKKPTPAQAALFERLVALVQLAKRQPKFRDASRLLEQVIDTCVMEMYFADHMAQQGLSIVAETEALVQAISPGASDSELEGVIAQFTAIAADKAHPLVQRIARRAAASPDLLGIILQEGEVGESDGDACGTAPILPPKRQRTIAGRREEHSGNSANDKGSAATPDTVGLFTSAPEAPARRFKSKAVPATDIVVEIERRTIDDISRDESLAKIRKVFAEAGTRTGADRHEALKAVSRELGFGRVGNNIREELERDMRTAVMRKIIERVNGDGTYRLATRTIEDYLEEGPDKYATLRRFVRAAIGYTWTDDEEAIRATARYLGFARVGDNIASLLKSTIRSGLLQRELERDGNTIRATR